METIALTTKAELFKQLDKTSVVLTPNARLALTLKRVYSNWQQSTVWETPRILPFGQWLTELWADASVEHKLPPLLSPLNESFLWERVVESMEPQLFAQKKLAKQLQQAYTHCKAWDIELSPSVFSYNNETDFFYRAVQAFFASAAGFLPQANIASAIQQTPEQFIPSSLSSVILAYFDEITPIEKKLITMLQAQGVVVQLFDDMKNSTTPTVYAYESDEDELSAIGKFASQALTKGLNNIAIVAPKLKEKRLNIERALKKHLTREQVNFSQGLPLLQFGLVNSAYALLAAQNKTHLNGNELHLLLFCPYIHTKATSEKRQAIYQAFKQQSEPFMPRQRLIKQVKHSEGLESLAQFLSVPKAGKHSLSHWRQHMEQLLANLGFPKAATLSSEEYQTWMKFAETLGTLANLHESAIEQQQALSLLHSLALETTFQPESQNEPIQVLGLIEALGQSFDALWLMDMTCDTLPEAVNPSPFIPLYIQREHNMPHSNEERESLYAEKVLSRLLKSADQVSLSYHRFNGDAPTIKSPLLSDFDETPIANRLAIPTKIEAYQPTYHIPLSQTATVKGGSFLIKEQARCPFRAFALYRLQLKEEREQSESLDDLDRGVLVHAVLESFWQNLAGQDALNALDEKALNEQIDTAITENLEALKRKKPQSTNALFMELERKRLSKLLRQWLVYEKDREPFSIHGLEEKQQLTLGKIELNMRVDRIDQLANGDKVVIDYKTGSPSVDNWFQPVIEEPQLPLYSLLSEDVQALMFAVLKSQETKAKGVNASTTDIAGLKPLEKLSDHSWTEMRAHWRSQFEALSDDFCQGISTPTPHKPGLCHDCHVKGLCGKYR